MWWMSLFPCWRRRQARLAEAAAAAVQAAERQAALRRIIDAGRRNERPGWDAGTLPLPQCNRPLMTPGQARRGHGGRR